MFILYTIIYILFTHIYVCIYYSIFPTLKYFGF